MSQGDFVEDVEKSLGVVRFYLMNELNSLNSESYNFKNKKDKEIAKRVLKRANDISNLMKAIGVFTLEITKS